jgi:hypothetical protein
MLSYDNYLKPIKSVYIQILIFDFIKIEFSLFLISQYLFFYFFTQTKSYTLTSI